MLSDPSLPNNAKTSDSSIDYFLLKLTNNGKFVGKDAFQCSVSYFRIKIEICLEQDAMQMNKLWFRISCNKLQG